MPSSWLGSTTRPCCCGCSRACEELVLAGSKKGIEGDGTAKARAQSTRLHASKREMRATKQRRSTGRENATRTSDIAAATLHSLLACTRVHRQPSRHPGEKRNEDLEEARVDDDSLEPERAAPSSVKRGLAPTRETTGSHKSVFGGHCAHPFGTKAGAGRELERCHDHARDR